MHATLHTSKPRRCSADSSAINSDSASLALPRRRASMPGTVSARGRRLGSGKNQLRSVSLFKRGVDDQTELSVLV